MKSRALPPLLRRFDGQRWTTVAVSPRAALRSVAYAGGVLCVLWACGDRSVVLMHRPEDGSEP